VSAATSHGEDPNSPWVPLCPATGGGHGRRPGPGRRGSIPQPEGLGGLDVSRSPKVDGESADRRDSVQPLRALVTIHLSGLPGDAPCEGSRRAACFPRLALLRVGFTEPIRLPRPLVRSYRTVSPLPVRARRPAIGGLLSVALSCESPRLAVSQHPALRSPDLPQHDPADAVRAAATWPTHRPPQSATHREAFAAHTASVGCRG
jgi:hypothetical protein